MHKKSLKHFTLTFKNGKFFFYFLFVSELQFQEWETLHLIYVLCKADDDNATHMLL